VDVLTTLDVLYTGRVSSHFLDKERRECLRAHSRCSSCRMSEALLKLWLCWHDLQLELADSMPVVSSQALSSYSSAAAAVLKNLQFWLDRALSRPRQVRRDGGESSMLAKKA
jgi:hypothetical protein